jgi:anti-sigma factor RsiW
MRFLERLSFMRDHRFTQKRLSAYLDEELPAPAHARVHRHVGLCPECRRVLEALRRTVRGLRSLGAQPRPGVAEGVIDRLRGDP